MEKELLKESTKKPTATRIHQTEIRYETSYLFRQYTSAYDEWPSYGLNTLHKRNDRIYIFHLSSTVVFNKVKGTNFIISWWKKRLDKACSNKETITNEEMKSVDEGSTLLGSKSEH